MGGRRQTQQQRARQRSRRAAAAAAKRRKQQRIRAAAIAATVVAVLAVTVLVVRSGDDDTDLASSASTTTTAPLPGSAADKPCVGVSGELPAGAPAVPVRKGPPPAELVIEDLKLGDGPPVAAEATISVHYVGVACSTGKIFDSSYSRNEPATFPLSGVIPGWQNGIPGMKVGGQRLLGIPSEQAYGTQGRPPDIAPDEALWFVVEVVGIDSA